MVLTTKYENLSKFVSQLGLDVSAGTNYTNTTEYLEEFKSLKNSFLNQRQEISNQFKEANNRQAQPQDLFDEDMTLEMSQQFFDIYIEDAFNNLFTQKKYWLKKLEAEKLNDFYKIIFGKHNKKYVENCNKYVGLSSSENSNIEWY